MISEEMVIGTFTELGHDVHDLAVQKGWYDRGRSNPELLALIHSELSECLEGLRHDNPPDEHCPEFSSAEIELADAIIRILDMAEHNQWRIGEAVVAKHEFNKSRKRRHGGKRY